MLDPKVIRERPEVVRRALELRRSKFPFDQFLSKLRQHQTLLADVEQLRARRNTAAQEVGHRKQKGQDTAVLIREMESVKTALKDKEKTLAALEPQITDGLLRLSNIPHETVPPGAGPEDNRTVREGGKRPTFSFQPKPHWEVGEALGVLDFSTAATLSGTRFALLRGAGAALERALISWMLDVHIKEHGYTEVFTPFLVTRETMQGTGQLPRFEEELFRCRDDELYLIPTAEVTLANLHRGETLKEEDLPRRYVSYSACFRREAGSYGKDTKGLIRNHQFDKVELVKFCVAERSLEELETLTRDAEVILQRLGFAYRVIELCTVDLGFASAKTYDLEVWMPGENRWREVSSCSTCTDFQARRTQTKVQRTDGRKEMVHTLNGSGVAVGRTFAAVLEHYQQADGTVVVPEVLRPYLGMSVIPTAKPR
ncbi:MAG: serine--tRNA ligase [Elusimicrobia bacterium]|nr:serine--tRNA ligase [Elusimicrobiota bacterium]